MAKKPLKTRRVSCFITKQKISRYTIWTSLASSVFVSSEWKTQKKNHKISAKLEPTPKIVEEYPKPVEQIPVRVAPSSYQLPAENFDYNDEEYVYYDEWIPIDASNEIQHD